MEARLKVIEWWETYVRSKETGSYDHRSNINAFDEIYQKLGYNSEMLKYTAHIRDSVDPNTFKLFEGMVSVL